MVKCMSDDTRANEDTTIVARPAQLVQSYGPGTINLLEPADSRPKALQRKNRLTWKGWKLVIARTVFDFSPLALMDRGAAMTYFTITAFAPTLLASYSLVTLLFPTDEGELRDVVSVFINQVIPPELREQAFDLFLNVVGSPTRSTVAIVISIIISLLSASAYVRAFSRSSNVIYGRTEGRSLPVTWLTMWGITLLMVVGGVILIAALVLRESVVEAILGPLAGPLGLTSVLDYLTRILLPVWEWLRYPVAAVAAVALVSCLYYFAPNVRPGRFRVLTIGSALALLVTLGLWLLFDLYVSTIGVRSAYGAFGAVLAVLGVIWLMNIVLLLGVKVDAEILRAKQLQVGWDSEEIVQAAPRSQDAVLFQHKIRGFLHRLAEDVKQEAHTTRDTKD